MRVTARSDYALRAVTELAASEGELLKREDIAARQGIPAEFLESVMLALKHDGIVQSQRGASGGFRLARPAATISLAEVIRAVDGPMLDVRGNRAEAVVYAGPAKRIQDVWVAVRASLREILEGTTIDDVVRGRLPPPVERLTRDPAAWESLGRIRGARRPRGTGSGRRAT